MTIRKPAPIWDGFEIHPIRRSINSGTIIADADELADFYTLYGVLNGDLYAIGDYNSRTEAEACLISIRPDWDSTKQGRN